jgi:hypothetical protein
MQALAGTRPWVRLCSIFGFIYTGLFLLIAIVIMTSSAFGRMGGMEILIGGIYLVVAAVFLFPSIKLWKFGSSIVRLMQSSRVVDLEDALHQQRGFWKFTGIMVIIALALLVLSIFGSAFATRAAAMRH